MSTTKVSSNMIDLTDNFAFTGTVTGAGGGDKRNYIIDGSFNHWVEGDVATFVVNGTGNYGHTLWRAERGGATAEANATQETSVLPTVAQSGYNSGSAMLIDVTTLDSGGDAGDKLALLYNVTGADYQALHGQQVTFAFWIRSTITGTFYVAFQNSAKDRSLVSPYTISSSNTWEYKTITVTLDTSGTWLFTEAGVGLRIIFQMMAGSTHHASSADTWQAGEVIGLSGNGNMFSSASNNTYFTQVGLYLGSSAPTFTSPSVTTVQDQVEYYIQHFDFSLGEDWNITSGYVIAPSQSRFDILWRRKMRKAPTVTSTAASTFEMTGGTGAAVGTSINLQEITTLQMHLHLTDSGSGMTDGEGCELQRAATSTTNLTADARH